MDKSNNNAKMATSTTHILSLFCEPKIGTDQITVPFTKATAHSLLSSKFSLMKRQKS